MNSCKEVKSPDSCVSIEDSLLKICNKNLEELKSHEEKMIRNER